MSALSFFLIVINHTVVQQLFVCLFFYVHICFVEFSFRHSLKLLFTYILSSTQHLRFALGALCRPLSINQNNLTHCSSWVQWKSHETSSVAVSHIRQMNFSQKHRRQLIVFWTRLPNSSNFHAMLDMHENNGHLERGESLLGLLWEMSTLMRSVFGFN